MTSMLNTVYGDTQTAIFDGTTLTDAAGITANGAASQRYNLAFKKQGGVVFYSGFIFLPSSASFDLPWFTFNDTEYKPMTGRSFYTFLADNDISPTDNLLGIITSSGLTINDAPEFNKEIYITGFYFTAQ